MDVGDVFPDEFPLDHSEHLNQIVDSLHILIVRFCELPPFRVYRRIDINGIPERMFASRRLTSVLNLDVAVWTCQPSTPPPHDSYWYGRDGVSRLVVEVVTPLSAQARANDMDHRRIAYARLGIREYWLLDTKQESPLIGYTLDGALPLPAEHRRMEVGPGDGQASRVLGTSLRWVADTLECWHAAWARWMPVVEKPAREAEARGRAEGRAEAALAGRLELLLAMGVPLDISRDLGLDLMAMNTLPGIGAFIQTQGDLGQLRRHIPLRPPDRDTVAARQYMTELLRAYPSDQNPGPGSHCRPRRAAAAA